MKQHMALIILIGGTALACLIWKVTGGSYAGIPLAFMLIILAFLQKLQRNKK